MMDWKSGNATLPGRTGQATGRAALPRSRAVGHRVFRHRQHRTHSVRKADIEQHPLASHAANLARLQIHYEQRLPTHDLRRVRALLLQAGHNDARKITEIHAQLHEAIRPRYVVHRLDRAHPNVHLLQHADRDRRLHRSAHRCLATARVLLTGARFIFHLRPHAIDALWHGVAQIHLILRGPNGRVLSLALPVGIWVHDPFLWPQVYTTRPGSSSFWYNCLIVHMTHNHSPVRNHAHRSRSVYEETIPRPPVKPSHAEIARLAYSYWEARGRHGGSAWEDWFRAEKELHARIARR